MVRVSFDDKAQVPEGSELHLEGTNGDYIAPLRSELGIASDDWLRRAVAFDVSLVSDGNEVELAAPAIVEVETTAIPAPESDGIEIALLSGTATGKQKVTNVSGTAASEKDAAAASLPSRVRFETSDLGTIGVAEVAANKLSWIIRGQEVSVW
jgi:hypothetical protein